MVSDFMGIVLVYACLECIRRKIWKRPLIALLHAAFVLIAVGYPQGGVGTHHALIIHYSPSPQ